MSTSQLTQYFKIDGSYTPTAMSVYKVDLVSAAGAMNSKHHEYTSRDGHVLGYLVDLTLLSEKALSGNVLTAPNSWRLRNSFRKFHFARNKMFRDAGITGDEIGRYGHTIRPYLDNWDATAPGGQGYNFMPLHKPVASESGDERIETRIYNTMGFPEKTQLVSSAQSLTGVGLGQGMDLADTWTVHMCDGHDIESATPEGDVAWSSVGMIQAYNEDRMDVVTPDILTDGETIVGPNNPLAQLRTQDSTTGDVSDIAKGQELEDPPYDIADAGDSIHKVITDVFRVLTYGGDNTKGAVTIKNLFVPAGILLLNFDQAALTIGEFELIADVKGIVECREYAI